jgi:hypothetical protein
MKAIKNLSQDSQSVGQDLGPSRYQKNMNENQSAATFCDSINPLKPSGKYMYQLL